MPPHPHSPRDRQIREECRRILYRANRAYWYSWLFCMVGMGCALFSLFVREWDCP
jgi:hypothetical protein